VRAQESKSLGVCRQRSTGASVASRQLAEEEEVRTSLNYNQVTTIT
jgi:chromosome condensin MukBEF MukE localization factor